MAGMVIYLEPWFFQAVFIHLHQMSVLSAAEQVSFDLIISAGRESGWLSVASSVEVETDASEVTIRIVTEDVRRLFAYHRNDQWLYLFLRDLAEQHR